MNAFSVILVSFVGIIDAVCYVILCCCCSLDDSSYLHYWAGLGLWLSQQRCKRRKGVCDPVRQAKLQKLVDEGKLKWNKTDSLEDNAADDAAVTPTKRKDVSATTKKKDTSLEVASSQVETSEPIEV